MVTESEIVLPLIYSTYLISLYNKAILTIHDCAMESKAVDDGAESVAAPHVSTPTKDQAHSESSISLPSHSSGIASKAKDDGAGSVAASRVSTTIGHENQIGSSTSPSLHQVRSAGVPLEGFKATPRLYVVFGTLSVITLMVALDGTSLSVALPVRPIVHV